jgi:uncharacterized protein involved in type VI secretion and phage assembly
MGTSLFDFSLATAAPTTDKIYGVAIATVLSNFDSLGEARVQVRLPWLPGYEPWARVATMMAGMNRGSFFIPQVNDEVLVAFNHGDVREPFVIGTLWNTLDRPPALSPTDAITKRTIHTPLGQELTFDEMQQSVTVSNTTKQSLTLDLTGATLAAGTVPPPTRASITLSVSGQVTIEGLVGIKLKAPLIEIDGKVVKISGTASTIVDGGAQCAIKGAKVDIG